MDKPGQELIGKLEQLRVRINNSGVERTKAILDGMGDDCSYYRKSLNLFLERDYDELKILIDDTLDIMESIDGKR